MNLSNITHENFCSAPWVNLHISTDNLIKPCCGGQGLESDSLSSSDWNYFEKSNHKLIKIKQELVDGKTPKYCSTCKGERNWYREFVAQPLVITDVDDFSLQSIDARWNNTCQLSCTYCNAKNSSKWAQLQSKKSSVPESYRISQKNIDKIYQLVANNNIKRVSMLGGEPLLIKENIKLLEVLPKSTGIEIFTNLNVVLESNILFEQLIQRPNVQWYVSMETIGKKFEFVRRGASWERQVANLSTLMSRAQGNVSLQSQYCVYSALHLYELYEFANQYPALTINWGSVLTSPTHLNFLNYPKIFKQQALVQIEQCINQWPDTTRRLALIRQQVIDNMDIEIPNMVENCIRWHSMRETEFFNNQLDFVELWPEYCKQS
jgi:MoaA/NifB/PqqE/SkfB family radical SAM enzyme